MAGRSVKRGRASAASKKGALTVVAPVEGGLEAESQRLVEASRSLGKAQWILVDVGQGLAAQLAQHPSLKGLKPEVLVCPPGSSDWSRFALAAPQAVGRSCLLLPRGTGAAPALFKAMQGSLGSAQMVFSKRPGGPGWAFTLQDWLWRLPGLDLGAPTLILRDRWAALAQALKPGLFLGLRAARMALQTGVPVSLCPAAELAPAEHGFSILGENVPAGRFAMAAAQMAVGALIFLAALILVMPHSHFFGLSLLGVGFFVVCTVVGEE
jgi:hypothetical protein